MGMPPCVHRLRYTMPQWAAAAASLTPAGLEPAIPGSVGRCLIHWATGPHASSAGQANTGIADPAVCWMCAARLHTPCDRGPLSVRVRSTLVSTPGAGESYSPMPCTLTQGPGCNCGRWCCRGPHPQHTPPSHTPHPPAATTPPRPTHRTGGGSQPPLRLHPSPNHMHTPRAGNQSPPPPARAHSAASRSCRHARGSQIVLQHARGLAHGIFTRAHACSTPGHTTRSRARRQLELPV